MGVFYARITFLLGKGGFTPKRKIKVIFPISGSSGGKYFGSWRVVTDFGTFPHFLLYIRPGEGTGKSHQLNRSDLSNHALRSQGFARHQTPPGHITAATG